MGNNKEQFITIQNLIRYVKHELNRLELSRDQKELFLHGLSREISNLNSGKLEQVSKIGGS